MHWLQILEIVLLVIFLIGGWASVLLRVPPVPSRAIDLADAFGLAGIRPGERVFDLGAGEGRVLKQARDKYGARVSGWELNPVVWVLAKWQLGIASDMRLANLWTAPISEADVVFTFLMRDLMGKVEQEIWSKMKPGARLVSNSFVLPNVTPTATSGDVFLYQKPL